MTKQAKRNLDAFEKAVREQQHEKYKLRLYISGTTPQSQKALSHVQRTCDRFLNGRYELEVIDIYQNAMQAKVDHIVAVPTLLKLKPAPLKRLVGDLSDEARVLLGLGLKSGDS